MPRAAEPIDVAIEASRRAASVALGVGTEVWEETLGEQARVSDLLPRLQDLLQRAGVERTAGRLPLTRLFAGTGPGSYTGLRVGLATAMGLARASGAALYGISSFEALAWAELAVGDEGAVVVDARAGRYYHGRYRRAPRDIEVLAVPTACTLAELAKHWRSPGPLLGHPELLEACGLPTRPLYFDQPRPGARALLELGRARLAKGHLAAATLLEPLYLRQFGARG